MIKTVIPFIGSVRILVLLVSVGAGVALLERDAFSMVYVDVYGSGGYSSPGLDNAGVGAGLSSPTILQYDGGATLGMRLGNVMIIGATADYRRLAQQSDIGSSGGSWTGTRFQVSPVVGLDLSWITLKMDVQFMGDYKLANKTVVGADVAYQKPFGVRAMALIPIHGFITNRGIAIGPFYESIAFGRRYNSISGDVDLNPRFRISQFGLVVALKF